MKVIHDPLTAHVCPLPDPSKYASGTIVECDCGEKWYQVPSFFTSKAKWREYYGGW